MLDLIPVGPHKQKLTRVGAGDIAYETLKWQIIRGVYKPGDRIVERDLAESLGVSRTPLRSALEKLRQEGMVTRDINGIVKVTHLSVRDAENLYRIRMELEGLAVEQAADRITPDAIARLRTLNNQLSALSEHGSFDDMLLAGWRFHSELYALADNDRLLSILTNIANLIARYRYLTIVDRGTKSTVEHERIIDALAKADAAGARAAARDHVKQEMAIVLRVLERQFSDRPE